MRRRIFILHRSRTIQLCFWLVASVLLLAACAPQATKQGAETASTDIAQKAWDLRQSGDYAAAAKEFLQLSKHAEAPQDQVYQLYAVETLLLGNDSASARKTLAEFPRDKASTDMQAWSLLLDARASLLEEKPDAALQSLDSAGKLDESGARARDLHELRAEALLKLNRPIDAIAERVHIEPLLADEKEIDANRETIWSIATAIPADELSKLSASAEPTTRGWLQLATLAAAQDNVTAAQSAANFQHWKQDFPNHPGEAFFAAKYPASITALTLPTSPKRVAVLLPLTGNTANAGRAVQDGITAAWLADTSSTRPVIDMVDASGAAAADAMDKAVSLGDELVIGPLEKTAVEAVFKRGVPPLPMIALNQGTADATAMTHVVQFALAPEDEARSVAERAYADGHVRAWALTADDQWGQRVFNAFAERWQQLGGVIVSHVTYSNNTHDFATPVKQLLDIEGSSQRGAELKKTLKRDIVTELLANQNVDVLFLGAFSLQARQIQPQLRFFGVRDLPIYATSHVYMGDLNIRRDTDLDGITFGDMPAIVAPEQGDLSQLLNPDRQDKSGSYSRLFAMGVDAYRMIHQAAAMRTDETMKYQGETGTLSILRSGQVHRDLSWMRFERGTPTVPSVAGLPAPAPANP
ncbi:MAG: penicillin-binding protein activator [Gammaproteobacteria bacterium]